MGCAGDRDLARTLPADLGQLLGFDSDAVDPAQSAKLYITNDTDNLYLAFVLDKCALDTSCTDPGQLWKAAHFGFSVSQYSESTTVQRVEYNGQNYEQYTSFMIGLVNGTKTAVCSTQGMDAWDLPADHYAVAFDAQAGTYTYEVKLPFERTIFNSTQTRTLPSASRPGSTTPAARAQTATTSPPALHSAAGRTISSTCTTRSR